VVLRCHSQSVSSASERAFMQRRDFKCLQDPTVSRSIRITRNGDIRMIKFVKIMRKTRTSHTLRLLVNYSFLVIMEKVFFLEIWHTMSTNSTEKGKDDEFVVSLENLRKIDHIFLICSPKRACPSCRFCCVGVQVKR
jgi:hypothetical protein